MDSSKKTDFGRPISPNNPFFTDESRAAPLNLSFSLITWDRETIYGQLELDLTAYSGRELLGHTRAAIQDRIGQLIADGYEAKYATAEGEQSTRTVGGNTVKFHLTKWYRVSTGEKRMKVTAPRIKLAYNNVNPKETKGSGIPGLLEFVGGAAAAATAQHEAAPAAEAVASEPNLAEDKPVKPGGFRKGEVSNETPNTEKWTDEAGNIKWPPNRGFAGEPAEKTLKPGTRFDRYGYEVVKPVQVQAGEIAPWFDQPGGGMQYEFSKSISDLLKEGIIKRVGPI